MIVEAKSAAPPTEDERRLRAPWRSVEIAFWVLAAAAYLLLPHQLPLLAQAAIGGLFALSVDLLLGIAGVMSLGHAAFFGIGGYVAGLLAQSGWGEPLSGLVAAGLVAGGCGFLSSLRVLRGSDLTRLRVTLGISLLVMEAANRMTWLTGGSDGLQGIDVWPIFGVWEFDLYGRTAYVYALGVLFACFLLVRRVVHSPFGLTLRGIKGNPRRMSALGTPVGRRLVGVYTLAAALAGIAGALLTQTTQFVSLDVFGFDKSSEALLAVVLGGAGTLYGAIVGALMLMELETLLARITPEYWQFWIGIAFMAQALYARGGILGFTVRLWTRLRRGVAAPSRTAP